ncbi:hypothetical protein [Flavobacterium sp.]|uniref:hypothetical protein n=1 Tax=Flavobacterium sp. TaxID=239 RepID=UPI003D2BED43
MKNTFLYIAVILFSFISCKKVELKDNVDIEKQQESESVISNKVIDTSYKLNTNLFDQYYYLMSESDISKLEDKKGNVVLGYNNAEYKFDIKLKKEGALLKEVNLEISRISDSDSKNIVNLYTEKYGAPKIESTHEVDEILGFIVTKVNKINDPYYLINPERYRGLSDAKYQEYIKPFLEYGYGMYEVSEKFHVVENLQIGKRQYYISMYDIREKRVQELKADVSTKTYYFKRVNYIKKYSWINEDKIINIKCFYYEDAGNKSRATYNKNSYKLEINYSSIKEIKDKKIIESEEERKQELENIKNSERKKVNEKTTFESI